MDLDWCLACGKRVDDKPYCSRECQLADDPSGYQRHEIEVASRPRAPALNFHNDRALTAGVPSQEGRGKQVTVRHLNPCRIGAVAASKSSRRSITATRDFPILHQPPNLVRPSSPVPPSLTKQIFASTPPRSNVQSSKELLAAVFRSRSPENAVKVSTDLSPPISLALSNALGIGRFHKQSRTDAPAPVSWSFPHRSTPRNSNVGHCQSLGEPRTLQRATWEPSSQMTLSSPNTQSMSSTLVDPGFQILPSKIEARDTKVKLINSTLEEVQPASVASKSNDPSSPQKGFFSHSHHFAMPNANMFSIGTQHQHYHGHISVLERLSKYTMPGAELDSSLREYPPRCHPGTRSNLLSTIRNFIHEEVKLIWVSGPAGAGKSALMQTLAEGERKKHLCAAVFLSRKLGIDDARRVFPTIAYQLAVQNEAYLMHLEEKFIADPLFLDKSLSTQFQSLVVAFVGQKCVLPSTERCSIFVDALDDLQDERDQLQILRLIHDLASTHPTHPLTWLVATRPKPHLTSSFAQVKRKQKLYRELHLFIDSEQARRDVQCFLEAEFKRIKNNFPDAIPSSLCWPTKEQFRSVTSSSSGFFACAYSVIRFVGNPTGDPITRLHCVVSFLDDDIGSRMFPENPFRTLDSMYSQIMSEIPINLLPKIKLILGYYLSPVQSIRNETSLLLAYNLLGLERSLDSTLRTLLAVVAVPSASNAHNGGLRILHSSFARYLRDKERSSVYWIDLNEVLTELWRRCTGVLLQWSECRCSDLVQISCAPDSITWNKSRGNLREEMFQTALSLWADLLYQYCHRWCSGACPAKSNVPFSLTLSGRDTLDVLQQLDFGNPVFFGENSADLAKFLSWLLEHTPIELRHQVVLQEFPLFKLDKPRFFKALCDKKWYRGIVKRHERFEDEVDKDGLATIRDLPATKWFIAEANLVGARGSLGDLVRLVRTAFYAANTIVTIFGTSSVSCCGLIRHQKSSSMLQYHIFPYSDTSSYATSLTMCSLD